MNDAYDKQAREILSPWSSERNIRKAASRLRRGKAIRPVRQYKPKGDR